LKYSDSTKKAILDKLEALIDEFVQRTLKEIEAGNYTPWERRLKAQIFKRLGIFAPTEIKGYIVDFVPISDLPKSFVIRVPRNKEKPATMSITDHTRIVVKDDNRSLVGYRFDKNDYIIRKQPGGDLAKVRKDLDDYLATKELTGIPIVDISTLSWSSKGGRVGERVETPKPKHKVFKLEFDSANQPRARSVHWAVVEDRVSTPEDVFVVLERFEAAYDFYEMYNKDAQVMKGFKKDMPVVYGYRSTDKKKINVAEVVGIEYRAWRVKRMGEMLVEHRELLEEMGWASMLKYDYHEKEFKQLVKKMTAGHVLSDTILKHIVDSKKFKDRSHEMQHAIRALYEVCIYAKVPNTELESDKALIMLRKRYPLLFLYSTGIEHLWREHSEEWIKYVGLVDAVITP
jgi:hypothetical protein